MPARLSSYRSEFKLPTSKLARRMRMRVEMMPLRELHYYRIRGCVIASIKVLGRPFTPDDLYLSPHT